MELQKAEDPSETNEDVWSKRKPRSRTSLCWWRCRNVTPLMTRLPPIRSRGSTGVRHRKICQTDQHDKHMSHNHNKVLEWSTQNHASRIKKAAAAIGWDCPLLTFTYPGFDCESHGRGSTPMVPFCLVGEFTTHFRTYFSGWIGSRSLGVRFGD